jgi:hypothetical protein
MKLQQFLLMMNQKAGSSQIFGQALPRVEQDEGFTASKQPASSKHRDHFWQSIVLWRAAALDGISSDPQRHPAVGSHG